MDVKQRTTTLSVAIDEHVAIIQLERPELQNRFDAELHTDFLGALDLIARTEDVRAVVLTSTGKVFSAGGDFDWMRQCHDDPEFARHHLGEGTRLLELLMNLPVPLVVALQGAAVGLGASVTVAADCVVAWRGAAIADPHVRMGLVAGDGGCLVWPQSVGMLRARRHLLTGDPVTAEDGWHFGLVTDLVDSPDDALPKALEIAHRIASLPPLAVAGTKKALNAVSRQRATEVMSLAFELEFETIGSQDLLEAIEAFQQRRVGHYKGQ